MTTTLANLVDEVRLNLLGFTADQEQLTVASSALTDSGTSLSVADATQITNGLIEIEDELMWASAVDTSANTVTLAVRGMYGTTGAAHASGSLVRNEPRFPQSVIRKAINNTIQSVYPDLYDAQSTSFIIVGGQATYALPPYALEVMDVTYDVVGSSGAWLPVRRYSIDTLADSSEYGDGVTITIYEGLPPGQRVNIVYRATLETLDALDDLFTDSGLAESAKDCIVYGACARLVGYTEPARLSDSSAEAQMMNAQQPGTALSAARYFYQMHLQARQEENRRLLTRFPIRPHFTR